MANLAPAPRDADLPYWVALAHCLKLGPTRFALLRRAFPTMAEAWSAGTGELRAAGLDRGTVEALEQHRRTTDVAAAWRKVQALKLEVVTIADSAYPALLREVFDPPAVLFYRGALASLRQPCLAVVGTRRATSYGTHVTESIVATLARAGLTIVSGLAYGIDASAHRAALAAGGATVAVLANGLDTVYPAAHQHLAEDIATHGGALITEFPPGVAALKQNFVQRNRVIAGLARGTLVIEGARASGALITARYALEASREVMAVPGSVLSEQAQGTNDLLKQGAHLVAAPQDVLQALGLEVQALAGEPRPPLAPGAAELVAALGSDPTHIDELASQLGLPIAELAARLTALELAGYVRNVGGQRYERVG